MPVAADRDWNEIISVGEPLKQKNALLWVLKVGGCSVEREGLRFGK
jgi:hypothetical protein